MFDTILNPRRETDRVDYDYRIPNVHAALVESEFLAYLKTQLKTDLPSLFFSGE